MCATPWTRSKSGSGCARVSASTPLRSAGCPNSQSSLKSRFCAFRLLFSARQPERIGNGCALSGRFDWRRAAQSDGSNGNGSSKRQPETHNRVFRLLFAATAGLIAAGIAHAEEDFAVGFQPLHRPLVGFAQTLGLHHFVHAALGGDAAVLHQDNVFGIGGG